MQTRQPDHPTEPDPTINSDLAQRIEELQRVDRSLYNLMGMEVWSIAKTMDDLYPGFWNQFMSNRRLSLKQFLQQKQAHRLSSKTPAANSNPLLS